MDPDPYWIRIGFQPKMLDPDPDEMNANPQSCFLTNCCKSVILLLLLCQDREGGDEEAGGEGAVPAGADSRAEGA